MRGRAWVLGACLLLCNVVGVGSQGASLAKTHFIIGAVHPSDTSDQVVSRYNQTAQYLNRVAGSQFQPPLTFSIIPVITPGTIQVDRSTIEAGLLDFALIPPFVSTCNVVDSLLAPLAVIHSGGQGDQERRIGTTIFASASNGDINSVKDIRGKKIVSVHHASVSDFLPAASLLASVGIHVLQDNLQVTLMWEQTAKIVESVLDGQADVGFLGTDFLDSYFAKENSRSFSSFKFLNTDDALARESQPATPSEASISEGMPEYYFLAADSVPRNLQKVVQSALLALKKTDEAAVEGGFEEFRPAPSVFPIAELMEQFGVLKLGSTARHECADVWNIHDSIGCPAQLRPKPPDQLGAINFFSAQPFESFACKEAGLECEGLYCLCSPCVPDVVTRIWTEGSSNVCQKMENCGLGAEQGVSVLYTAEFQFLEDQPTPNCSWQLTFQGGARVRGVGTK